MAAFTLRLGAALIVFSPSIAVVVLLLAKRAQLMILTILAAFVWLVAVLGAALLWRMMPEAARTAWPLAATIGVLVQESGRMALVNLYRRPRSLDERRGPRCLRGSTPPRSRCCPGARAWAA